MKVMTLTSLIFVMPKIDFSYSHRMYNRIRYLYGPGFTNSIGKEIFQRTELFRLICNIGTYPATYREFASDLRISAVGAQPYNPVVARYIDIVGANYRQVAMMFEQIASYIHVNDVRSPTELAYDVYYLDIAPDEPGLPALVERYRTAASYKDITVASLCAVGALIAITVFMRSSK